MNSEKPWARPGRGRNLRCMSIPEYARSRRARGLPGATAAGVRKAIASGRITSQRDGKLDPDLADREWRANTNRMQQLRSVGRRRPAVTDYQAGFVDAAHWVARGLLEIAREHWPAEAGALLDEALLFAKERH